MTLDTKDDIGRALSQILNDAHPEWVQIGLVLSSVKKSRYWSYEFRSFSKWLEAWGAQVNLGKATLWRYITAQEKYERLRSEASEHNYNFPPITQLECPLSPEGIEIFDKLSRVLEEHDVYEMMKGFIEGEITRKELRDKWNIYKPVLAGKTARGLPESSALKTDLSNKKQQGFIAESIIMDGLRVSGSRWLCENKSSNQKSKKIKSEPDFFKFFQNVRFPKQEGRSPAALDVVLGLKENDQYPLHIHGVEVVVGALNKEQAINLYRRYCNAFWIAMPEEDVEKNIKLIPDGVGLFTVKNKEIKVLINAEIDDSPELLVDTLKVLLTRWKSA